MSDRHTTGRGTAPGTRGDPSPRGRPAAWVLLCGVAGTFASSPPRAADEPPDALPAAGSRAAELEASLEERVLFFVEDHCDTCHGRRRPKADISLVAYTSLGDVLASRPTWKRVLDAVEGYEMPPPGEDGPPREERERFAAWVRGALAEPELGPVRDPGRPVPRRLTRLEYNNTVRDLLGLETDVFPFPERVPFDTAYFEPARGRLPERIDMPGREYGAKVPVLLPDAGHPGDSRAGHGFSNRGDVQNASAVRIEQYVRLAGEVTGHPELLERAERLEEVFPNARFRPRARGTGRRRRRLEVAPGLSVASNGNVRRTAPGSAFPLEAFRKRVRSAFEANRGGGFSGSASHTTVPGKGGRLRVRYGKDGSRAVELDPSEDIWIAAFATAEESSGELLFTNRAKGTKEFFFGVHAAEGEQVPEIAEVGLVVLGRRGQSGRVVVTARFSGGREESLEVELPERPGAGSNTFVSFAAPGGTRLERLAVDGSGFTGDYVLLDDLVFITRDPPLEGIEGKVRELPAPAGDGSPDDGATAEDEGPERPRIDRSIARRAPAERLRHFVSRAFRRRVGAEEVAPFLGLYESRRAAGADDEAAMRTALQAVLSSPGFLYLAYPVQPDAGPVRALRGHELASRLGYFLWSSLPDDELLALGASGELVAPSVLEAQVRRMLRSPKCRELAESFFVEWLDLRELWSARPDPEVFGAFYSGPKGKRTLARDMFGEALLLFETVLVENRPVIELLDHGFTYVNSRLAEHYGLDGVEESGDRTWHRVRLPDRRRGGILTLGATLTLTSFPTRTSPIRRGAWVLDVVFRRPPPPPQIAVADLDKQEGIEDDLTVREKVELHREEPSCAICHDRIDPPGFALQNFDGIGGWRETEGGKPVDPSGTLPWGASFDGPVAFKDALRADARRFLRGFVEHLLSYALGRELEHYDDATVEGILDRTEARGHRLRDIIVEVVRSPAFRYVRNTERRGETE